MKTPYKTSVPARDLPQAWQEAGEFAPEQRVTVTVEPEDSATASLRQGIEAAVTASERGESRELTDADFEAIKRRGRERLRTRG